MIVYHYLVKTFRDHLGFFVLAFLLVAALQLLILTLVITMDFLQTFRVMLEKLPPPVQQLLGEEFIAQLSVNGAAAFGYNHPLVVTLMAIMAIILPAKHIAGEIEEGTLELVFSLPVKRQAISISLWVLSGFALLLLVAACCLGTLLGTVLLPETRTLPFFRVFQIGVNLWLLMLAINAYTFLIASFSREGGKAAMRSAGITLIFFFVNYAVNIWPTIDFLEPLTIFHYYQPQKIMMGDNMLIKNLAALAALIGTCIFVAFRRINTRDIPG